jgi:hypothetical protein
MLCGAVTFRVLFVMLCGYSRSLLKREIVLIGTEWKGLELWLVGIQCGVMELGVRVAVGTANIVFCCVATANRYYSGRLC